MDIDIDIVYLLIVLGVILVSMILHELAHGLVAYALGDDTAKENGRLSLNPIKHIDPVMSILVPMLLALSGGPIFGGAKPVPVDYRKLKWGEWGMALVAVAGPLTNFLIAFLVFLVGHFTGWLYGGGNVGMILVQFVFINLGFGLFNLFPIPPLDGSRVLYALAPRPVQRMMMGMERYGIMIVFVLVMVFGGVLGNVMSGAMVQILRFFEFVVGA